MALKRSSEIITVSGRFDNNTGAFAVQQVDLQLNPLDQEVFVVLSCTIDFLGQSPLPIIAAPLASIPEVETPVALSVSRPAAQLDNSDSNVFAYANQKARLAVDGAGNPLSYFMSEQTTDIPDTNLDYIAIIATNDFFVGSTDSGNNVGNTDVAFKVYGYRAKADAATYAALVQSEVLSS